MFREEPLAVNSVLMCLARDNEKRKCKIIQRKMNPDGTYQYYVHYADMDRRMDEWVSAHRLSVGHFSPMSDMDMKEDDDHHGKEYAKVKNIEAIVLNGHRMEAWYYSAFPYEYTKAPNQNPDGLLYFCDFCLKFFVSHLELEGHAQKCAIRHPPGNEICRQQLDNGKIINMFEVDGAREPEYCQNLCYLAKLFLDHKTTQYDTEPFLFYVLCEVDDYGCQIVGYFSKEKFSETDNNVACILTLPAHQRKGLGNFLIQFSYELSRIEGKGGTPERPLSDLGEVTYRRFWTEKLVQVLTDPNSGIKDTVSVNELSRLTCFQPQDITDTLLDAGLMKYTNSEHYIDLSDPKVDEILQRIKRQSAKPCPLLQPENVHWAPYKITKQQMTHYQSYQY